MVSQTKEKGKRRKKEREPVFVHSKSSCCISQRNPNKQTKKEEEKEKALIKITLKEKTGQEWGKERGWKKEVK